MMRLDLSFPADPLWPNKRGHWAPKSTATKKARREARAVAMQDRASWPDHDGPYQIKIIVFPKSRGPAPDEDNASAAAKAFLDGIADALGVNDRLFKAPIVETAKQRHGRFVIEVS